MLSHWICRPRALPHARGRHGRSGNGWSRPELRAGAGAGADADAGGGVGVGVAAKRSAGPAFDAGCAGHQWCRLTWRYAIAGRPGPRLAVLRDAVRSVFAVEVESAGWPSLAGDASVAGGRFAGPGVVEGPAQEGCMIGSAQGDGPARTEMSSCSGCGGGVARPPPGPVGWRRPPPLVLSGRWVEGRGLLPGGLWGLRAGEWEPPGRQRDRKVGSLPVLPGLMGGLSLLYLLSAVSEGEGGERSVTEAAPRGGKGRGGAGTSASTQGATRPQRQRRQSDRHTRR